MFQRFGVERGLRNLFFRYGGFIARHPLYFVLIPLFISLALGSGMLFLNIDAETDAESLYAPENSRASRDRDAIKELYSIVQPEHDLDIGLSGQVIVTRKDQGNVLTTSAIEETLKIHQEIMSITIHLGGKSYNVHDLCIIKTGENCYPIGILELLNYNASTVSSRVLTYPISKISGSIPPVFMGSVLAGVTYKEDSSMIESAKSLQLMYYLRHLSEEDKFLGSLWLKEFLKYLENVKTQHLDIYRLTSSSLEEELSKSTTDIIGLFSISFSILISFSIATCVMTDWVRSKPTLAFLGVLSAGLAIITSFGLLTYIGVPFIDVVGSTPFLIIGIGIDDMFLMVAAWRKTDVSKTTEHRMKEAFSDAAMSITITSITDVLAFCIGAITPFYSIRIFCLYSGVAVLFDYIFQITFFAGCMAMSGYREEKNRHAITLRRVLPKEEAPSTAYRIFCAGGYRKSTLESTIGSASESNSRSCLESETVKSASTPVPNQRTSPLKTEKLHQPKDATQHLIMVFFRDTYGPFLTNKWVIPMICVFYVGYLAVSIWGVTQLEQGLTLSRLAPDGSYAAEFFNVQTEYFSSYGAPVSFVVTEQVDYSSKEIQQELRQTISELENSPYFHDCCSSMWLEEYIHFLDNLGITEPSTDMFYLGIKNLFLKDPMYNSYTTDIVLNDTTRRISSSRFYVIPKDTATSTIQKDMMLYARHVASRSSIPMIAYSNLFPIYEQYVAVLPNTLQNLGIAIVAMFVVSAVMLPTLISSLMTSLSLISIIVGVIGFMAIWGVSLDLISMINIIVSIGFTVDFSAHIIYAYSTANSRSARKRAIEALYTMGMPIIQAALSTIVAILILYWSDTYIFRCFFKIMLLVMVIGAVHGLVFLPVFLMLLIRQKPQELKDKSVYKAGHDAEHGEQNIAYLQDSPLHTISNRAY